jgi:hypothetical protein
VGRGWERGLFFFLAWMGNRFTESQEVEGKTTGYLEDVEDKARGGVLKLGELSFGMKANGMNGVKCSS